MVSFQRKVVSSWPERNGGPNLGIDHSNLLTRLTDHDQNERIRTLDREPPLVFEEAHEHGQRESGQDHAPKHQTRRDPSPALQEEGGAVLRLRIGTRLFGASSRMIGRSTWVPLSIAVIASTTARAV